MKPAVHAPPQEEYEKVEVTFSAPNKIHKKSIMSKTDGSSSSGQKEKKKSIRWKPDDKLQQVFYFELDETERGE